MKKFIALGLLLLVMATGAFALDMVIGAGAMYDSVDYINYDFPGWGDADRKSFGGFVFFGINRFLEFNLGYIQKDMEYQHRYYRSSTNTYYYETRYRDTEALQLGALVKYPIPINDKFVFFPSLGLDFDFSFDVDDWWWHELWLRGGLGLDFFFTERLFLRGHFNYGPGFFIGNDHSFDDGRAYGFLTKLGMGWMF